VGDKPVVTALWAGGMDRRRNRLFSGCSKGNILIWSIPTEGLGFQCLQRLRNVHSGPVNSIRCANRHVISAGDDGVIRIFALYTLSWGRGGVAALEKMLPIEGRALGLHIENDVEDVLYFICPFIIYCLYFLACLYTMIISHTFLHTIFVTANIYLSISPTHIPFCIYIYICIVLSKRVNLILEVLSFM